MILIELTPTSRTSRPPAIVMAWAQHWETDDNHADSTNKPIDDFDKAYRRPSPGGILWTDEKTVTYWVSSLLFSRGRYDSQRRMMPRVNADAMASRDRSSTFVIKRQRCTHRLTVCGLKSDIEIAICEYAYSNIVTLSAALPGRATSIRRDQEWSMSKIDIARHHFFAREIGTTFYGQRRAAKAFRKRRPSHVYALTKTLKAFWAGSGGKEAWFARTAQEKAAHILGLGFDSVLACGTRNRLFTSPSKSRRRSMIAQQISIMTNLLNSITDST
jgi:hypothetical protein